MERLTKRIAGVVVYVGTRNPYSNGQIPCEVDSAGVREMMYRLAAYEDSRCAPEEVLPKDKADEIALKLMRLADLESLCGIDRLRELAEADKDGRVVVLPCKDWLDVVFGDQVLFWGIDKSCMENPIREISVDDAERITWYGGYKTVYLKGTDENGEAWEFYPEEIGKTVFLTREEAKKALEAMREEEVT
jgi:hypothetical protein